MTIVSVTRGQKSQESMSIRQCSYSMASPVHLRRSKNPAFPRNKCCKPCVRCSAQRDPDDILRMKAREIHPGERVLPGRTLKWMGVSAASTTRLVTGAEWFSVRLQLAEFVASCHSRQEHLRNRCVAARWGWP
jgi:hypothetical protein